MTYQHEWLEVANRRWCLCCGAFQSRRSEDRDWTPAHAITHCPMDTPYAERKIAALQGGENSA